MEMKKMDSSLQQQLVKATSQIREGRMALTKIVSTIDPASLVELLIAGAMSGSESVPVDVAPPPPSASNVERSASSARSPRIVDGRPSLSWGMQIILSEGGAAMHVKEILKALIARKWDPKTKSTEKKLANVNSVLSSQKKVFRSDKKAGKGFYGLVPGVEVPPLPASIDGGKKTAPASAKPAAKVAVNGKKPTHKPLAERKPMMGPVLKLLKAARGQVTTPDIAKQLKVEPNLIQGPILALIKSKSIKGGKKNDEGATLFSINRDNLNAHIKRFEAAN
jgi:hypothetical protein